MIHAIVMIDAEPHSIPETAQAIADIPGVTRVFSCAGDVDLIAMVDARDHAGIADVITGALGRVPGVRRTTTHIAFASYARSDVEDAFSIGGRD